jgi:hydrogenase-4 component B
MNTLLISLIVIGIGGLLPLPFHKHRALAKGLYLAVTLAGCVLALSALSVPNQDLTALAWSWMWLHTLQLSFACDSLSRFFLLPIFIIFPLAVVYSAAYFSSPGRSLRTVVCFAGANFLAVAMVLVTVADNIPSFALAWEVMSLSSFLLVLHDYERAETRQAGYLYFLFTQAGALLLFAAFAVAYGESASLSFVGFAGLAEEAKLLVFFLALLGFGSKAGVFPLHVWLPHAHPAAPSHISALMSGVMIKMGIYGMLRLYFLLASQSALIGQVVLVLGIVSGVLGVLYALGKHNLKRLLAYHSVENIGIILIGAGLGMIGLAGDNRLMAGFGFAGALLHVLNHSLFKSLLFLGAGAVIKGSGTAHVDQLGGLLKRMPITGNSFLVGSVSISGLPPFNGFVSEFLIYFAAFQGLQESSLNLLLAILAIIALAVIGGLASFCFTKVVGIVFLGEPRSAGAAQAREASLALTGPMVVLALLCVAGGLFPQWFIGLAQIGLADRLALGSAETEALAQVGGNLALAARLLALLLVLLVGIRKILYRGKVVTAGPTWGCGFTRPTVRIQYTGSSFARSVVQFFRPFVVVRESKVKLAAIFPGDTHFTNHVEDIAEVGLRCGLVTPLRHLLERFRWIQHGNVQLYIGYIIAAIGVLLVASFI